MNLQKRKFVYQFSEIYAKHDERLTHIKRIKGLGNVCKPHPSVLLKMHLRICFCPFQTFLLPFLVIAEYISAIDPHTLQQYV